MSVIVEKPLRSDAGKPRIMGRDAEALSWLSDMRAITEPDLGVLLGRIAGRGPVAPKGVEAVVRRWRALGLVDARRILVGEPRVVTLTQAGAELVGYDGRYTAPAWTQVTHTVMCSRVRLWTEATAPELVEWVSERRWRQDNVKSIQAGSHVPDGVWTANTGEHVAVEVELTSKTVQGVVRVLDDLAYDPRYDVILYWVASDSVERTVRTAYEHMTRNQRSGLRLRPMDTRRIPEDLAGAVMRRLEREQQQDGQSA